MSDCRNETKNEKNNTNKQHDNKSLFKHAEQTRDSHFGNQIPLCACKKGSMTVEAAVIIPLVAGFLACFLFFFRVMEVQTQVYAALSYASRRTASAAKVTSDTEAFLLAEGYLKKELGKQKLVGRYVSGGAMGVSMAGSSFAGENVDLMATYYMKFPVGFFQKKGIAMRARSKSRKWIGKSAIDEEAEACVYITPEGKAYHKSTDCHYLKLSIREVERQQVEKLRNKNDHRYLPCEVCAKQNSSKVFITDYGEAYHENKECLGLKRTIMEVKISEVGGRKPCSKCYSN